MTASFAIALVPIAFVVSVLLAPYVIAALRRLKFGKQIRADGPATHQIKAGTPTMGGSLFIASTIVVSIIFVPERWALAPAIAALILFGTVGALDDLSNMKSKQGLGFKVRHKVVWHVLISVGLAIWLAQEPSIRTQHLPGGSSLDLGWWFIPLAAIAIFACAAGVNEVDGLDGLAGGTSLIAFVSYLVLSLGVGLTANAAFCAAICGSLLGFLWFNVHPAKVFMGDTGALALGAALAVVALETGWGLLLPIIGFVFVLDLVSVILQVGFFRLTHGRRLFRMTPIHHGFELMGWPETLVTQRFWIMGILAGAVGLVLSV